MASILGLDIGGANLKAAHGNGVAHGRPFELWKEPERLGSALRDLLADMPSFERLAVTMTGELCDCFESRRQGVLAILRSVEELAGPKMVCVWSQRGFLDLEAARQDPLAVGSANWLALAHLACRYVSSGCGMLFDIGSTTTDIVPLRDGQAAPRAYSDVERLRSLELVYTGVRRTPVCAILGTGVAAELFATTQDVFITLEMLPENPDDRHSADGRPATRSAARSRLARMLCGDAETIPAQEIGKLAERVLLRQVYQLAMAFDHVARSLPTPPATVVLSGEGEFLGRLVLSQQNSFRGGKVVSLGQELGPEISRAACAHAVAVLSHD